MTNTIQDTIYDEPDRAVTPIIVDETIPVGEPPPPFPKKRFEVNFDDEVTDHYIQGKKLGEGRFGIVYEYICKKTGLRFAGKTIKTNRKELKRNVEREIDIMKMLNEDRPHPKLIQIYDAFDMGSKMVLVLEQVEGGELFRRIDEEGFVLTERACAIFVRQICEAIEFIHSKNVLHLDMKPENVLCLSDKGNRIKICDFGLARKYDPRKKLQVLFGTPEFVAPEVVNFDPIGYGTDLWSLGVICFVLVSGESPFLGDNFVETMTNVTLNKYDFDYEAFDDLSEEVIDFIERLLVHDKFERLTPDQCLRHKWMKKMLRNAPTQTYDAEFKAVPEIIPYTDTIKPVDSTPAVSSYPEETINSLKSISPKPSSRRCSIDKQAEAAITSDDRSKLNIPNDGVAVVSSEGVSLSETEKVVCESQRLDLNSFQKKERLSSPDRPLSTTKKEIRNFVERWSSNPSSPYMVSSPSISGHVFDRALSESWDSTISSFELLGVGPAKEDSFCFLDVSVDTDISKEPLPTCVASSGSPYDIAKQLEQKLTDLQTRESMDAEIHENTSRMSPTPLVVALKIDPGCSKLRRQDSVVDEKAVPEKYLVRDQPVKHKPSRDVPIHLALKTLEDKTSKHSTPDHILSPSSGTPIRRSRRPSRDENSQAKDMVPSHGYTHRRPSRDVPSHIVTGRLSSAILPKEAGGGSLTQEFWPDICISQDINSDEEIAMPITAKLELPVIVSPSLRDTLSIDVDEDPAKIKRVLYALDKSKSLEDHGKYKVENKKAAWVLNLESMVNDPRLLPVIIGQNSIVHDSLKTEDTRQTVSANDNRHESHAAKIETLRTASVSPRTDRKEQTKSPQHTQTQKSSIQDPLLVQESERGTSLAIKSSLDGIENKVTVKTEADKTETSSSVGSKGSKPLDTLNQKPKCDNEPPKELALPHSNLEENKTGKQGFSRPPTPKISKEEESHLTSRAPQNKPLKRESPATNRTLSTESAQLPKSPSPISGPIRRQSPKAKSPFRDQGKPLLTPRTSAELDRPRSSNSLKPTQSMESLETVATPWGPMRRSPSRGSLKSPERNVIMINLADTSSQIKSQEKSKNSSKTNSELPLDVSIKHNDDTKSVSNQQASTVNDNSAKDISKTTKKEEKFKVINIPIQMEHTAKISPKEQKTPDSKPLLKKWKDTYSYTEERNRDSFLSERDMIKSSMEEPEVTIVPIKIDISYEELFSDSGSPKILNIKNTAAPAKVAPTYKKYKNAVPHIQATTSPEPRLIYGNSSQKLSASPSPKPKDVSNHLLTRHKPSVNSTTSAKSKLTLNDNKHYLTNKVNTQNNTKQITNAKLSSLNSPLEKDKNIITQKSTERVPDKISPLRPKSPFLNGGLRASASVGANINTLINDNIVPDKMESTFAQPTSTTHNLPPKFPENNNSKLKPKEFTQTEPTTQLRTTKAVAESDKPEEMGSNTFPRRKSRSSQSPTTNSFRMSLFSAQDRISLFETKPTDPPRRVARPISRSKTTTTFSDPAPSTVVSSPKQILKRSSFCERTKPEANPMVYTHE